MLQTLGVLLYITMIVAAGIFLVNRIVKYYKIQKQRKSDPIYYSRIFMPKKGSQYSMASPISVQSYLDHVDYPASKRDLIDHAEKADADETILTTLEDIPDRIYNNPKEINVEVAKLD